ncbi:MAG: VOC family protein [Hyphomicrobiales bacterium]|nr:VOC family protein [Hyphomicrobiales bacterium]
MTANGSIWWNELHTSDDQGAISFYTQLVGWRIFQLSGMDSLKPATESEPVYTVWMMGWSQAGGMMKLSPELSAKIPPSWMPFIAVGDVDACADKAVALGGEIVAAPFDVANSGRFAILRDPQGALFGIGRPGDINPA